MKKQYIALLVFAILLSACSDFLTQSPRTASDLKGFFESKQDFKKAVVGMYAPLQDLYDVYSDIGAENYSKIRLQGLRSDNLTFQYNSDDRGSTEIEDVDLFTVKPTNSVVEGNWDRNYLIISRANQVLAALQKTELSLDQSFKKKAKGQALFLRAFSYFDLVRNFGNIPIYLKPVTDYKSTFKSQSPSDEVYKQIISDAKKAASLLPNKWKQGPGRASAAAAYTLLGAAYLTLHQYGNAEDALMNVVKMSDYGLLANYANIFKPSNEGNKEMIFAVQFGTGFTAHPQASSFPIQFLPYLSDISVLTGVQQHIGNPAFGLLPTPDLISAFGGVNTKDERFDASIGFYSGPSPLPGVPYDPVPYVKKYLHPHSNFNETDQNWPVYRYSQVLLMLARAINEQGGKIGEAKRYLNMVRNRAGLNNSNASTQQELGKAILHEFRLEFAFENKRWYSLQRTENAIEVMTEQGERVKANPKAYYYPGSITKGSYLNGRYNVTKNSLLYPIPSAELNVNPKLNQNPGY